MTGNDWLRTLAEKTVTYLDSSKEEREQNRISKKSRDTNPDRPAYWFGELPFLIKCWRRNRKSG